VTHKNPWCLITSDEIATAEDTLRDLREGIFDISPTRLNVIIEIFNEVQDRQP
jgi:hypothetical protein